MSENGTPTRSIANSSPQASWGDAMQSPCRSGTPGGLPLEMDALHPVAGRYSAEYVPALVCGRLSHWKELQASQLIAPQPGRRAGVRHPGRLLGPPRAPHRWRTGSTCAGRLGEPRPLPREACLRVRALPCHAPKTAARRDDRWRRTGGGRASPPRPLRSPPLSQVPCVPGVACAACLIAWLMNRLEAGPHREPAERGCATEARDHLTTRWSRPASRVGSIGVRLAFVETGGSSRSHRAVGRKPRGASAFRWLPLDPPPDSVESVLLSVRERVVPRSPP